MSAEVETMFSVREVPWHGLGTIVEEKLTAAEALKAAELDWEVAKVPVYVEDREAGGYREVPRHFVIERVKDQRAYGTVGSDYRPLQNTEAFSFFDNLVDSGEAKYETAGSLSNGKVVWIMAQMPEGIQIGGVDPVDVYLLLSNRHDGSGSITVAITPVRVVCQNTLNMALKGTKREWRVRHVGTMEGKLAEAREALALTFKYTEEFAELANRFLAESFSDRRLHTMLDKLADSRDLGDRAREGLHEGVGELFTGKSLDNVAGTKWAAFNAVSEYFEHTRKHGRKNLETRVGHSWFGDQRTVRQNALALLS